MPTLVLKGPTFFSVSDERLLFEWFERIGCVSSVSGRGRELVVQLKSTKISNRDLREFLALFRRYGLDMQKLAQFENARNREWFANNPKAYWYKHVFRARA
jgi:hypothetical protein